MRHIRPARAATGLVTLALCLALGAAAAAAEVFHLTGQAHPRFHLTVTINGTVVKTAEPSPDKPLAFLTTLDEGLVRPGENEIDVAFERLSAEGRGDPPVPSFVVRVKRQTDPADSQTATELIEIRGPRRPYDAGTETGRLRTRFTVTP